MFYRTDPNDPGILVEFLSDRRLIIFIDDANWISFTTVDRYIYVSLVGFYFYLFSLLSY